MTKKAAFLYDFLLIPGGAEKMALHVIKQHPGIDAIFGFIDRNTFPEKDYPGSRYRALTSSSSITGWQGIKAMSAFHHKAAFLRDYETVIYSGLYSPVAVQHHPTGCNIYYCHTIPRFIYDLRSYYLQRARAWQKPLLKSMSAYIRPRYEQAVRQMGTVVANSANVRRRLEQFLGLTDVKVIHPPVETGTFTWFGQDDFYLSTARLEPYKRVDLVVRAFMGLPKKRLIVASGGSELKRLQAMSAGSHNIEFIGWCTPEELQQLTGQCIATIYLPVDEDFGMSPVESMAAGKPVIGVAQGGLLETVVDKQTGILIDPRRLEGNSADAVMSAINAIREAIVDMDEYSALSMRKACEERAALFSLLVFDRKFSALLRK